jgi:hypothetical protein
MANAIWSKDGVEFKETPDTPEFSETAKTKGYKRYYDITKDDKDIKTVPEDMLETAKTKGYKIFGQPAIEAQKEAPAPAPMPKPKPKAEPSWLSRTAESAVESVKAIPSGVAQLGKEVITQPAEAIGAGIRGVGKTFGIQKVGGAAAGLVGGGKALLSGEEFGPAYERSRQFEEERFLSEAEKSQKDSPAAYGAAPYIVAGAATAGAGVPALVAGEVATGAAQQLAEKGEIDTAELAGQTVAGGTALGVPAALKTLKPATAAEKATKLERSAVAKAEQTAGLGDIAEQYTGPGAGEKIRTAKRAGFEAESAKGKYKQLKTELDNEFNSKKYEVDQRNAKLESEYSSARAQRASEYNELIKQFDAERQRVGGANQEMLSEYTAKLEAHNLETNRFQQQYNDSVQKFAIEKADLETRKQQKAKQVDEEYLGQKQTYEAEELPQWQEKAQQQKANNAILAQENKMKMTEWSAEVKRTVDEYKATARELRNEAVKKAKDMRRTLKGETVTAMGDELRNMLDNMQDVQNQAYEARKQVAASDANVIDSVDEAATTKAIDEVEKVLNTNYLLDEAMREDLKAIKMKVNPELNETSVNRGTDFEALLETRQYLDNVNNDLRLQARGIQRQGGSVPVELTNKRKAIRESRQRIQGFLYGEQSVFSPELKSLGEAADNIYADFRNAKGAMQQRGIVAKEKAVPGMESALEPRTALIENYFDELDAGRKAETKQLLQDFGIDVKRLELLEEQVRRGVIPETVALDQLKLPDRPVFVPPSPLAPKPTAPMRPLPSQYNVEGGIPVKPIKPTMPMKPTRPTLQPIPSKPAFEAPIKPAYEAVPGKRLMAPEEMQSRGYIAEQEALAQEFRGLGGKTGYDDSGLPTTKQGALDRVLEYGAEALGIGQTPMQLLERAAERRQTPTMVERAGSTAADVVEGFTSVDLREVPRMIDTLNKKFPQLRTFLAVVSRQGKALTPAMIRAVARSKGISEEQIENALAEQPAP